MSTAVSDPILSFPGVGKTFIKPSGDLLRVIDDVNFSLHRNHFTALVGPSGCGKSTLLEMAVGLDSPTEGEIVYKGQPVRGLTKDIGYVTQQANLLPWFTLRQNVEFPLVLRDTPKNERADKVAHYLQLAGLTGFEDHYPYQLSGGMQKRASIVRTLIYSPTVILMDEPFGSLDAQTKMLMQDDLLRLWQDQRQTILFITHDLTEAVVLADDVVLLSNQPTRVKATIPIDLARPR
ncbi:MAG: ABC transporter ATP-binding protein, partial [Actinomycetota bacterium]|nr:ABC transporter ATP-binding protein [Actinomycetota bacterium]